MTPDEIQDCVRQSTDSAIKALTDHVHQLSTSFKVQEAHFEDIKLVLGRIEGQTTKTNGRVTRLESWQNRLLGGAAIVSAVVIPLAIYSFNLATNEDHIAQVVSKTLNK